MNLREHRRSRRVLRRFMVAICAIVVSILPVAAAGHGGASASMNSASSSLTVDEIVAKYVATRGGLKKIRSVVTLRQTGRASTGAGRTALIARELKRPAKTRFEFTVQGVTGVFISDGREGWQVSPFEGDMAPVRLADEAIAEAAEQADIEGPLVDWKNKGHQIELVGRESIGDHDAYKLKTTLRSGDVRYDYIDAKSFRLIRSDTTRAVRGRMVQLRTTFDDFTKAGGLLFPRRIEVEAVGRPQRLTMIVDKIEVNPSLNDARFRLPATSQR